MNALIWAGAVTLSWLTAVMAHKHLPTMPIMAFYPLMWAYAQTMPKGEE